MMTLSRQLIPLSSFHHVGLMVMFMTFIACFSAVGFLFVKTITSGWIADIDHSMMIELPPYMIDDETLIDQASIDKQTVKVMEILKNDPVILMSAKKTSNISDLADFGIAMPAFIQLTLNPDRADNSEDRIRRNINRIIPNALVKTVNDWQRDIVQTATYLKLIFCGLALSIFLLTTIMLSAIIKAQLKASKSIVELFHIMGASPSKIASLFQISILRPIIWGILIGLIIVLLTLSHLISFLDLGFGLGLFYAYMISVSFIFIALGIFVTRWVVARYLWAMP
jgi:cell division protein FtsX